MTDYRDDRSVHAGPDTTGKDYLAAALAAVMILGPLFAAVVTAS
jgi:hypothetical protein